MHVHKPLGRGKRWVVLVTEGKSPTSPIKERLTFEIREAAYRAYYDIKLEIDAEAKEYITITAEIITQTSLAYLLSYEKKEMWFPKRVLTDNKDGTFLLDKTWAYDHALI